MPLRDLRVPSAISNHKPLVPRHAAGEPNAGLEERGCRRSCESIRFDTSPTLCREFQSSFIWLLHEAKAPSEIGREHSVTRQPQHSTTKGPLRLRLLVMNVTPVSSSMSKPLNWPDQTRSGCAVGSGDGSVRGCQHGPLAAADTPHRILRKALISSPGKSCHAALPVRGLFSPSRHPVTRFMVRLPPLGREVLEATISVANNHNPPLSSKFKMRFFLGTVYRF